MAAQLRYFGRIPVLLIGVLISGCTTWPSLQGNVSDAGATGAVLEQGSTPARPRPSAVRAAVPENSGSESAAPDKPVRRAACDRRNALSVGMTRAQVYASCWGRPKSISTGDLGATQSELLVYDGYNYVYLENGVVRSFETAGR